VAIVEGKDRRKHPRLTLAVAVDFTSGNNFYSALIRDISMGGLFIETDALIPIGTQLLVDLRFLMKHMRVECEVMWAVGDCDSGAGVGVRFLGLQPSQQKSIEAFMVLRRPLSCGEDVQDDPGTDAQSHA
jgi:uncharacterized protein (TIGR02266 family)